MQRWARTAASYLLGVVGISACSGGGCSSGCGMQPIAGGYPASETVENAVSLRITRPGLDFLGSNAKTLATNILSTTNGVYSVEIAKSSTSVDIPLLGKEGVVVCRTGPSKSTSPPRCYVDVRISDLNLRIDAISPSNIKLSGTVPLRVQNLPMSTDTLGDFSVGLGNGGCSGGTPSFEYKTTSISIEIPTAAETLSPRSGYTKLKTSDAQIALGISSGDVSVCKDCGLATFLCNPIYAAIKDAAFGSIKNGVISAVKSTLADALCMKPNASLNPPCPKGSSPNDVDLTKADKCLYDANKDVCVSTLLGVEGRLPLGSFLSNLMPGSTSAFELQVAAFGVLDPAPGTALDSNGHTPNGATLAMRGGTRPSPKSACVPQVDNPVPTGIPVPQALRQDKVTPWPTGVAGPHVGLAISERFLNYALTGVHNSGGLCFGLSTEQAAPLNTGLVSVLIPSLRRMTFEQKAASAAIVTRPQRPPTVIVGTGADVNTDPLLQISLSKFAIDFYVFAFERYIRALTYTADVTVPLNLQTGKDPTTNPNGGLLPVLGKLQLKNSQVTNADLLLENPANIATGFEGIITDFLGTFLSAGFSPFDVSSALASQGLALSIPDGSIRKLTEGKENFVALFANLSVAPKTGVSGSVNVNLLDKLVYPENMALTTARADRLPKLRVQAKTDLTGDAVEYSWWIDRGTHSVWSHAGRESDLVIDTPTLLLQGKHSLFVSARNANEPSSEVDVPAQLPFTIDTLPPEVSLTETNDGYRVGAWDIVSGETLEVRTARANEPFGPWQVLGNNFSIFATPGEDVRVEVRDEEGNVASTSSALIRGRSDTSLPQSSCTCSAAGAERGDVRPVHALLVVGVIALIALRRRTRRHALSQAALATVALVGASAQGCSCDGDPDTPAKTGCGDDCNAECGAANTTGIIGAYLSLAQASDGSLWFAGYNDIDRSGSNLWGDLVVGKYDASKNAILWQTIDGIPSRTDGTCPPNDPRGWRNGETNAGPNVGLWTSLQIGNNGSPMVAYHDATDRALKFAWFDGAAFHPYFVSQATGSDIGRYAKLVVTNGKPTIAHLVIEPGKNGYARSRIVLAKASLEVPKAKEDWSFEDVATDDATPCRPSDCIGDQVCTKTAAKCQKAVTCDPACKPGGGFAASQACVLIADKATCDVVIDSNSIESYPNAYGLYLSAVATGSTIALVGYDRLHGNLVAFQQTGSQSTSWSAKILDGETGSRKDNTAVDTGDAGIGATLAIDDKGIWHVAYVNGMSEALQYVRYDAKKNTVSTPEIVDNGEVLSGKAFGDGKHIVGDDASISVDSSGTVTIVYQDATAGTLRLATGVSKSDGTHTWSVKAADQPGRFAGFFPRRVPGSTKVANFWRRTDSKLQEFEGDVALVEP